MFMPLSSLTERLPGKKRPASRSWLAALLLLMFFCGLQLAGRSTAFRDPGTFFHTAVGERILSSGSLVRVDFASFSHQGQPWLAQQWLGEVLLALLFRCGGFDTQLLWWSVLFAVLLSGFWLRTRYLGLHPLFGGLLLVMVLASCTHHFLIRPHLWTIFLMAITGLILENIEETRLRLGALWIFPALFCCWANLHGGVLAGIATLGWVFLLWSLAWGLGWPSPVRNSRQVAGLAAVLLCSAASVSVNPYGIELLRAWYAILGIQGLHCYIIEHLPSWYLWYGVFPWLLALLYLTLWFSLDSASRRRPLFLLPLPWAFLGIAKIRDAPLFAVLLALQLPLLVSNSRLIAAGRKAGFQTLALYNPWPTRDWRRHVLVIVVLAGIVFGASIFLQIGKFPVPVIGSDWVRLPPDHWPVELVPQLRLLAAESSMISEEPMPIFNDMAHGGFLTMMVPQLRTFIDDRCELLGQSGLRAYRDLQENPHGIEAILRKHSVRVAMTVPGTAFDDWFQRQPQWVCVASCTAATLFRQVTETH